MDTLSRRLFEGFPKRYDRLQPAAAPVVRPTHVSGVRVRLQCAHHGRRPVQRVHTGHRGPKTAVCRRSRLRVRGQSGRHRHYRVRVRVAHIADGVASPELDIRTVPVLLFANAPGQ